MGCPGTREMPLFPRLVHKHLLDVVVRLCLDSRDPVLSTTPSQPLEYREDICGLNEVVANVCPPFPLDGCWEPFPGRCWMKPSC